MNIIYIYRKWVLNMKKIIYVLQGNYGYGWDDLCEYEDKNEAREDKKCYEENEKYPHRIIVRCE